MIDYEKLIEDLSLKKAKLANNNDLRTCCPDPSHHDKSPSFFFNIESQEFNCFGCPLRGKSLKHLYLKVGRTPPEWVLSLPTFESKPRRKIVKKKGQTVSIVRNSWIKIITANTKGAVTKLDERDIFPDIVKKFRIGYNSRKDILFFPCFSYKGDLIGWAERSDNYSERYKMMPEGITKESLLYGEWFLKEGEPHNIYLVEGTIDCLKLWGWGFKALCIFGSVLLPRQRQKIIDLADQIIIIPDNDKGGLKFRTSVLRGLKNQVRLSGVNLPDDIGDVGDNAFTYDMFKKAVKNRVIIRK